MRGLSSSCSRTLNSSLFNVHAVRWLVDISDVSSVALASILTSLVTTVAALVGRRSRALISIKSHIFCRHFRCQSFPLVCCDISDHRRISGECMSNIFSLKLVNFVVTDSRAITIATIVSTIMTKRCWQFLAKVAHTVNFFLSTKTAYICTRE